MFRHFSTKLLLFILHCPADRDLMSCWTLISLGPAADMPAKMTLLPGHSIKLSVSTEDDRPESTRYFEIIIEYTEMFCTYLKQVYVFKFYGISRNYLTTRIIQFLLISQFIIDIPNVYDYTVNSFNIIFSWNIIFHIYTAKLFMIEVNFMKKKKTLVNNVKNLLENVPRYCWTKIEQLYFYKIAILLTNEIQLMKDCNDVCRRWTEKMLGGGSICTIWTSFIKQILFTKESNGVLSIFLHKRKLLHFCIVTPRYMLLKQLI